MKRLARRLWSIVDIVIATLLAAMIALVFANVVLRYGFASGIRQSVELARLWFVWSVMLGAAVVLRRGEHLALTEVSEALFPRAIPLLRRLCWAVVILAVVMLFIGALNQTIANWSNISQLTGLPSGLFYLAGVVSAAMMAAIALLRLIDPMQTGIARLEDGE
ncbi:TRAP transporter small permease [Rhodobacter sp. HX-7-19]|uniref:TRAP transporter small permease protein n=1 Tax=Paragemmobacter kunshanensis TaxID=2583234 RepID=A0A6M1U176_9RHOB|nr:TRAP transporter small permease [Rhodobacter kunshanensis]NGQ92696.1 TRAP transporter small permease [Rhodobacter kunshanensis]